MPGGGEAAAEIQYDNRQILNIVLFLPPYLLPVLSPLAALSATLQTVCTSAAANAALLKKNEAATRAALIDPVLRALGWNTADVSIVEPERTIGSELRVDYLLHDAQGKPRFVVEAKCLGASLDKHGYVSKVLGYALGFKVQTVFITDGLNWHCYPNLHQGNTEPAVFELTPATVLTAGLTLIQWLDAAHCGHGSSELSIAHPLPVAPLVAEAPRASIVTVPKHKVKASTKTADNTHFVELTQINTLHLQPGQKPKQLRLPDGSVRPLRSWKDILTESCLYFLQNAPSFPIPFPDKAGKKTDLLMLQKPPTGINSKEVRYQGKPIFIYTNYSAPACLANALYILSKLPATKQQVVPAVTF